MGPLDGSGGHRWERSPLYSLRGPGHCESSCPPHKDSSFSHPWLWPHQAHPGGRAQDKRRCHKEAHMSMAGGKS